MHSRATSNNQRSYVHNNPHQDRNKKFDKLFFFVPSIQCKTEKRFGSLLADRRFAFPACRTTAARSPMQRNDAIARLQCTDGVACSLNDAGDFVASYGVWFQERKRAVLIEHIAMTHSARMYAN
jgi:hypothetical protein